MTLLKWDEAITKVLEDAKTSLHYEEITERIFEKQYRTGRSATPAATVHQILGSNINRYKGKSPFVKVGRGVFILRKFLDNQDQLLTEEEKETETQIEAETKTQIQTENNKIINAFGIYWDKNLVYWKSSPDLLGVQKIGASEVNFKEQIFVL